MTDDRSHDDQICELVSEVRDSVMGALAAAERAERRAEAAFREVKDVRNIGENERREIRRSIDGLYGTVSMFDKQWAEELRQLRSTVRTEVRDAMTGQSIPGARLRTWLGVGQLLALTLLIVVMIIMLVIRPTSAIAPADDVHVVPDPITGEMLEY